MALITESIPTSPSVQTAIGIVVLSLLYYAFQYATRNKTIVGYPIMGLSDNADSDAKADWKKDAMAVLSRGIKTNKPFQILSNMGPILLLPNRFAHEIKNDERFDFTNAVRKEFFSTYKGFDMFADRHAKDTILQETVRTKLTQSLGLVTNDLVEEADLASLEVFPESKGWRTVKIKDENLQLVARLSARVFLGVPMCRQQSWLDISKNYTVDVFMAAQKLREVRPWLCWIAQYRIPECQRIRKEVKDAQELISSEVEMRRKRAAEAIARGEKVKKTADAVGWMVEIADKQGVVDTDYGINQIRLSVAAIHTTTETLTHAMIILCKNPEALKPLRDEIVSVIKEHGWNRTTLYKLRLMDSFLKETQRLRPLGHMNMLRLAKEDVTLSEGTVIRAGTRLNVLTRFNDPATFPEPEKFKVDRYLNLRSEPGQENSWQMATTNTEHLAFGLGTHACPGRFFAVNELKVALVFMLLRYDWALENDKPMIYQTETRNIILPGVELKYRSRTPELDLVSLMAPSTE